jgi:hypothetical protein
MIPLLSKPASANPQPTGFMATEGIGSMIRRLHFGWIR